MKHKTAELEGALLDAAVAKAERIVYQINPPAHIKAGCSRVESSEHWRNEDEDPYLAFSTNWLLGGPIIERERIETCISERGDGWWANLHGSIPVVGVGAWGPTPLVAAMRAYVASKLGNEVELP